MVGGRHTLVSEGAGIATMKGCSMHLLRDDLPSAVERWELLAAFAGDYLRPFTARDSISRDEITQCEKTIGRRLPKSLADYYVLCGNARDIWCRQDEWIRPERLWGKDGVLFIWQENQGNWRAGIKDSDSDTVDPPVVWDGLYTLFDIGKDGEYTVLADTVSEFALNMLACVAKFSNLCREQAFGDTRDVQPLLDVLERNYTRCPLKKRWVIGPVSYFQDAVSFVEVSESDGFVYPILKTPEAVDRFISLVDAIPINWGFKPERGG